MKKKFQFSGSLAEYALILLLVAITVILTVEWLGPIVGHVLIGLGF